MATLLPPPKRQKVYHGVPEPEPEAVRPSPNVVVQFVSEDDGSSLAPAVSLPANVSRDDLQVLVNKLTQRDDDPVPFQFHIALPADAKGESTRIVIAKSIEADVLAHPSQSFSEEDVFVVHCSPQSIFRVRPATRCSSTLSGHTSPILCASFSPTGSLLATGSGDANARLWDLQTETPSHTLSGHKGWVLCVEWEALERKLATGGHDNHVRLWDPKTGTPIGDALKGHTKWITSLAWEPIHLNATAPRLASSSKDGTVRVWAVATRQVQYTLGGHTASVNVVRWGGGGLNGKGVLYTASSDRTVRVWDATNGRPLHTLKDHAHWVTTLALNTDFVLRTGPFDHTGKRPASDEDAQARAQARYTALVSATPELMISGSDDHTLFLWSLFPARTDAPAEASAGKLRPLARLTGHQRQIAHVAFSPDGRWAASAAWDNSVRVWEGRTGKFVATLRGHIGAVYRLTWSADSRLLVSASKDTTLKVWDLKTYKIKTDLPGHTDEVYCVDFVADKIVSGGRDRTVKIWKN
ncbi:ribosome assembly protein [Auriscalpium vulgare]|uniref:Ribosome assembly protein n=1 Tax=Auriscalpium vulgare TaxID=40419 RepID=A0ACB8RX78_9AGAM|nr:ribosome assembly protein [Auriscalpium vulgare]